MDGTLGQYFEPIKSDLEDTIWFPWGENQDLNVCGGGWGLEASKGKEELLRGRGECGKERTMEFLW